MELPRLEQLWNDYCNSGLSVVAVEAVRDRERAVQFIEENKISYRTLENLEGESEIVERIFGIGSYPTTYLIDRTGKILFAHVGFSEGDEKKLEEEIKMLP